MVDYTPLFCHVISRLVCLCQKVFLFYFNNLPPSSEARASSCFDFFFPLLAPDSYCCLEAISPPASNCLSAYLTPACCQSLQQCVWCQITYLFFSLSCLGLTWCSTRASLKRCPMAPVPLFLGCLPQRCCHGVWRLKNSVEARLGGMIERSLLKQISSLRPNRCGRIRCPNNWQSFA